VSARSSTVRTVRVGVELRLRAEYWMTLDSLRAAVRDGIKDGFAGSLEWALDGVEFLGTEVQERQRSRIAKLFVGVTLVEVAPPADNPQNAAATEFQQVCSEAFVAPGPRLIDFRVLLAAVDDEDDMEKPLRVFGAAPANENPARRHLGGL
jgi:hypothetical protein